MVLFLIFLSQLLKLIEALFGQLRKRINLNIDKKLLTKFLRHYTAFKMTYITNKRKITVDIKNNYTVKKWESLSTGVILTQNLSPFPKPRTTFVGKKKKEIHLNIEKNHITKLLTHLTVLKMIYILNDKPISEGIKINCTVKNGRNWVLDHF